MKVFSCIAILVCILSLVSSCCLPVKSALWDCKARKMDELLNKWNFLQEKKFEMKSKLELFKQRKHIFNSGCGKLPCNCELVYGTPIEKYRTVPMVSYNYRPCQCGSCCRCQ